MIELKQVSVRSGSFELRDISLHLPKGSYGVLMGRTGSGKTTLLEAIIGFKKVTRGVIRLSGRDVTMLNPALREIGYVPQDGALFSTMTVAEHLGFALKIRKIEKTRIQKRVAETAEMLGISHLLDRTPFGLSGGERQRVAIGRAISFEPTILCLDEPLSALDAETRDQMCELLEILKRSTGVTTLHITHNQEEAVRLADSVFRLTEGQLKED